MEILRIKNVTYSYIGSREKILSSVRPWRAAPCW